MDDRSLPCNANPTDPPTSAGGLSASLRLSLKIGLILALASLPAGLRADPFSSIVVYGDSLSDNGNLFAASGQTLPPSPPYDNGRFSNGPVTVEQMAAAWGVPLHDFAFGGATTGLGNLADQGTPASLGGFGLPGMQTELAATQASLGSLVDLNTALFVVWGGPNDFLGALALHTLSQQTVDKAVSDLTGIVATLQALGAKNILVPGMPDLGLTPEVRGLGAAAAAQASLATQAFNSELTADLPAGATYFDTASLLLSMYNNPAAFGFTNVTDSCLNGTTVCANPDQYLFWDGVHPTTAADTFIAGAFEAAAVPEPAPLAFLTTALALGFVLRRRLLARL